jgi:threonine dehydrogenase-like Zn-dependent dehydrogenase
MRAAVFTGPHEVRVKDAPVPEPRAAEVLIRVEGCGVCGSSLPVWEGRPWFTYPLDAGAPGHEAWGTEAESGRRVAFLCERGYAEYAVADTSTVVPLPPELDGVPFPGEAFACAVNVVRRSDLRPGIAVAVVGLGFLGSAIAALCRRAGADVVEVRRDTPLDALDERFERVIEAAGTQEALDSASRLVATRGRLVIAGFHQDGSRVVDLQSWNWRGLDVVNAHERDPAVYVDAMREAVEVAAASELDVAALVTHRFPLEHIAEAFAAAAERPPGFVKAWVAP